MFGMPKQGQQYVVGFGFAAAQWLETLEGRGEYATPVLLVRKNSPEWQHGKLNGPGGKIEPGEGIRAAMVREFAEETGLTTTPEDWEIFQVERFRNGVQVYYLRTHRFWLSDLLDAERELYQAAEPPHVVWLNEHGQLKFQWTDSTLRGVSYLLNMAFTLNQISVDERPMVA